MRILIVTVHRNIVGGVEKYLQAIIPALASRGHAVALIYEYAFNEAVEAIDPREYSLATWCATQTSQNAILAAVKEWKPDIVYSHGLESVECIELEAALLHSYPSVLYVHNYDRTCATGRKSYRFPQIKPCTRRLGPMCLLLHYPRRCGGLHPLTMWRGYNRHTKFNTGLDECRRVLVASRHMFDEINRHGVPRDNLHIVPLPPTDVTPETTAPAVRSRTGEILFIGRLTDLKGVHYLIKAVPKAAERLRRPLTLTVAGNGPERDNLHELASKAGAKVEFVGWVNTQDKLNLMHRAELLAVPSLWPEPFGLVGIEAGCVGLPAVAYSMGGILDWLLPGETGELAPSMPPSVEGLADAIVRALVSDQHYATLSRGAWEHAKQFATERHLAHLEQILCFH